MATGVASQVILHPTASQTIQLLGTTAGRDKTYRTIQYFSRFLAWFLISRGHKESAARWNALKSTLAMGRKMIRLGKPLEFLQAALRAAQNTDHFGEQITTIGRQLAYAAFLTYDSILWASGVKFINLSNETKGKVGKIANRFWLTGILLNLAYGLLKAGRLADEIKALRTQKSDEKVGDDAERNTKYHSLIAARAALRYQFIIDSLDVWIPAANLGLVHSNDGVLGFLGTISSIMALRNQWQSAGRKK